MLLAKREKKNFPIADFDPFGALSLFDELWPSSLFKEDAPFRPAMDVSETDKEYVVQLEVPGLGKDDIKIEYDKNILTLSGEKKYSSETKEGKTYRSEIRYGAFSRSLRFADVDADKISAAYNNGILEIKIPKTEAAKPKRINIS